MAEPHQLHILVDGFNVIFGIEDLHQSFKISQEIAKEQLTKYAQTLHDEEGHWVTVVFDGQGSKITVEHPLKGNTFAVVHSPSNMSADGVIERMLSRSNNPEKMMVISNDRMVREAALASCAQFQGIEAFMDWSMGTRRKGKQRDRNLNKRADQEWGNRIPL